MTALVELDYSTYISTLNHAELKQQVDDWLMRYDKWLSAIAYKAQRRCRMPYDAWRDLKQEMILQAYAAIDRFDATRGVPLGTYLISTLWSYPYSKQIRKKYEVQREFRYDITDDNHYSPGTFNELNGGGRSESAILEDKSEVSSLEHAHGILSMLDGLLPHECMLMKLHYELGLQLKQIDEMMGVSRATTWHRIQRIIGKLQEKAVAE